MQTYISIFYGAFCLLLTILGAYSTLLSVFSLFRQRPFPKSEKQLRFAVLVPARNEERCIAGIVESIHQQDYPKELVDIYVIPNHCTDNTAGAALAAGAQIIQVSSAVQSKGHALQEAFSQLLTTGSHDAFCVFDADNEPDPRFLSEMNNALSSGARAAKSRIFAKNPQESWVCACYDIFFCNANHFLNRARRRLGLSARLIGTGFAVRRDLMEELGGWNTTTLTEDAEFYAMLSAQGEKIAFVPGAITYDEEPISFHQSLIQRRRWVSGIMGVGRMSAPDLLRGVKSGKNKALAFDALAQFSFTLIQAWIIPAFLLQAWSDPASAWTGLPTAAVSFYMGAFFTGGMALLLEDRLTQHTGKALFLYPLFVFSFLPLQTISLFRPIKVWHPIHHTGLRLYPAKVSDIRVGSL